MGAVVRRYLTVIFSATYHLVKIMVSIMITCNASRRTAATRGGGTSEQDGREGKRTGDQAGSGIGGQGSGRGGQESDQGIKGSSRCNRANGGGGEVPDFATIIAQQLRNILPTIVASITHHLQKTRRNNWL
ncbi:hypothetical protein Tco_0652320 [Tanacetum coccineum]|uniref:Uncharacterized protein n=1 Tax=Tanacetum coccineum TaxID=301880 RepID=A0ABQ4WX90_9ASTR